jgi:predicted TIM-barrel fold metal-dependent hydrolase
MVIDVHTHLAYNKIFPDRFIDGVVAPLEAAGDGQMQIIKQLVTNSLQDKDGGTLIGKMDAAGIDKAVLLIADFGYCLGEAALPLEQMFLLHHEVMLLHPDRFMVFGGVDPRRGIAGVDLFERSISSLHFSGLKLYPPCGFELDDPGLYPLYEICNRLELPVLTHTGPSLPVMRTEQRYPATIRKVAKQFPRIRFILGHGGARDCDTTVAIAEECSNVFFDISTFQVFTKDPEELNARFRHFFDTVPDRVLFGTDWPMFLMSASQRQLKEMIDNLNTISTTEKEKLLGGNAAAVLSLI